MDGFWTSVDLARLAAATRAFGFEQEDPLANPYYEHTFSNGLHLLVEPMDGVQSAAFTLLTPAGVAHDPPAGTGTANLLSDLVTRGAGERDSRALTLALDNLGLQRYESAEIYHTSFTASCVATNLVAGLELVRDIVCQPHLNPDHLEMCRLAALQEIEALDDEPGQKVLIELKRRALPEPLGRPTFGAKEHVEAVTIDAVREFHRWRYRPNGAILGVAGAVEFGPIQDAVERLFADWETFATDPIAPAAISPSRHHIVAEKIQTHIGIAFPSVAYSDADYYNAHGAVGVLSGGMSARLFTELREKRGLCYAVGASFHALQDRGVVVVYAGTTNERAGETMQLLLAELRRLCDGIGADEVRRVQAGLKSSLIMQEESTSARASILARGWFYLGRVRTLEEVSRKIDQLTPASILEFLERHPPRDFTILTLGPQPLDGV